MAEWIHNEDGGYYCSECGYFIDDYYLSGLPNQCKRCGTKLSTKTTLTVDRYYRLSRLGDTHYCDDADYPKWLLDLREGLHILENVKFITKEEYLKEKEQGI